MAVKLHRCGTMWLKISAHPCWRVQKALDVVRPNCSNRVVLNRSVPREAVQVGIEGVREDIFKGGQ